MASASSLFVALPIGAVSKPAVSPRFQALPVRCSGRNTVGSTASRTGGSKRVAAERLTALALAAAMVVPEIAEAAQPGLSPSLKDFLFSILSGGVVVGAIIGAVIAVSNFDPVKRS